MKNAGSILLQGIIAILLFALATLYLLDKGISPEDAKLFMTIGWTAVMSWVLIQIFP